MTTKTEAKTEAKIESDSLEEARAFLEAAYETRDIDSSERNIQIAKIYILIDIAESLRELNDNLALAQIKSQERL
jgi:hypothetical protein